MFRADTPGTLPLVASCDARLATTVEEPLAYTCDHNTRSHATRGWVTFPRWTQSRRRNRLRHSARMSRRVMQVHKSRLGDFENCTNTEDKT